MICVGGCCWAYSERGAPVRANTSGRQIEYGAGHSKAARAQTDVLTVTATQSGIHDQPGRNGRPVGTSWIIEVYRQPAFEIVIGVVATPAIKRYCIDRQFRAGDKRSDQGFLMVPGQRFLF